MKIDRLDLLAYGPFTNVSLDLSGGDRGLHLIHGPNEAGKSTALRALRGWLFGFPTRLGDDFKHSYSSLRVGGVLRDENGGTFESIRRKATKKTLRAADDESDSDEELLKAKYLGGISQDDFNLMLTIDFDSLSAGGEAAFKNGGKLAELLFGSGLDLAALSKFQKSLEAEIESLFKPSGQIPTINKTLRELEDKRKDIEAVSIKGMDWTSRKSELAELQNRRDAVEREWRSVGVERERLRRIAQARPDLGRRETLKAELIELVHAPKLVADFPERRRKADDEKIAATAQKSTQAEALQNHQDALDALPAPAAILDDASAIDAIQTELGIEQQNAKNRLKQEREMAEQLKTAADRLGELGREETPEQAIVPKIKSGLKAKLNDLSGQWNKLNAERDAAARAVKTAQKKQDEAKTTLEDWPALKNIDGLQRSIERTRNIAASPEDYENATRDFEKLERQAKTLRAKLGEIPGSTEEIVAWPVPTVEILERYREEFHAAEAAQTSARNEFNGAEDRLAELKKTIELQRRESEVPDLSTQNARRSRRDAGWRLVKADWLGNKADEKIRTEFLEQEEDLPSAFEGSIRSADEIADRLRLSADAVAIRAGYLAEQAHLLDAIEVFKRRRSETDADLEVLRSRWSETWAGVAISPLRTPREMILWANHHMALVEKVEQIADGRDRLDALDTSRASAITDLHREIVALDEVIVKGEELDATRDRANAVVTKWRAEASKQEHAEKDGKKTEKEVITALERLADFEEQLANWRKSWALAVESLGLAEDISPQEALAVLENTMELAKSLGEVKRLSVELLDADNVSTRFREQLASLLAAHAPEVSVSPEKQATEILRMMLIAARKTQSERQTLSKSHLDAERAIQKANEAIERSRLALKSLASEAGIDSIEGLAEVERLAFDRAERERELRDVEGRLRAVAPGISLDDLDAESKTISPEESLVNETTLDEDYNRLDAERHELSKQIGEKNQQLRTMETTAKEAKAEAATSEREHLIGLLETDVERYVHLKLSLAVLRGSIEEYRNQNEAPVLRRASEHFARCTLGSFAGLRAELDEKNESVLFGIRPDGKSLVGTSGMSVGTVDQLYLAMKLASVEHYFQARPPLPLIVDDLLIQFDDERAVAALESLAELSRKTQVLFFTHHEHLVQLAENRLPAGTVFVHRLGHRVMSQVS